MRFSIISLFIFLIVGCTFNDPYDPLMGPRNPRPGAEKYLSSRNDISDADKKCLLNFQPCSRESLKLLVDAPSREVRSLVAANLWADEAILEKLIRDKDSGVRQYVASNPKTPKSILLKLQNDTDKNVKWSLEQNPNWINGSHSKKQSE